MNVIILIESFDQSQFFKKFKKWFEKSDLYPTIITDKLSIYINLKLTSKINICLLNQDKGNVDVPDLNSTFEILTNQITINNAQLLYSSVYICAESLVKSNKNSVFFIWGGTTISSFALKNVALANSTPTLYFDFGNYNDKIFVDPNGTNIDSFIYKNFELLLNYPENKDFTDDQNILLSTGGQKLRKNINLFFLFDIFYYWISGLPFRGEINPLKKIYFLIKPFYKQQKIAPLKNISYYFIAFSHSYELKRLNLEIPDVVKRVHSIIDEAKNRKIMVYAKFHPTEIDKLFITSINELKDKNHFMIVDNDSDELIEQAIKVYLFNTSLAISCILKGKDISFLSKSFFDKFDKDCLINYLEFYLLQLQSDRRGYFLEASIERIFKRLEISQNYTIK